MLQYKQIYLFMSYFSSPVIIQTNSTLAWEVVKNMYMDEPESWNHFAIDTLNRTLLEQSAAIGASLKTNKQPNNHTNKQKRRSWLTILS